MTPYITLVSKEIRDLFFSRTALLISILSSALFGYSFYSAVNLYSTASTAAIDNPLYATGFEPIPGVFVPTFGGLFILVSLFLPFLFIPTVGSEKSRSTLTLLLQLPFGIGAILSAKAIACVLYLLLLFLLGLPALVLWKIWGGHIPPGELFLLLVGHMLYGILVVSVSLLFASVFESAASASIGALALIISSWMVDFGRDMSIAPIFDAISRWTWTRTLKVFEDGIASSSAVSYFLFLSAAFFAMAYILLRIDLKAKWKSLGLTSVAFLAVMLAFSQARSNADITESRRNSFPLRHVRTIESLPSLEIDIYLERTDSRFKDYEKSFLRKFFLVRGDITVRLMTGDALKENYGLFIYRVDGKAEKTISNSDEEIFLILSELRGDTSGDQSDEGNEYPGYPLVTDEREQSMVIHVYFIFIPLIISGAFALHHKVHGRRRTK